MIIEKSVSEIVEMRDEMVINKELEDTLRNSPDSAVIFDIAGVRYSFKSGFGVYDNSYYVVLKKNEGDKDVLAKTLLHYIELQKEEAVIEGFDIESIEFLLVDANSNMSNLLEDRNTPVFGLDRLSVSDNTIILYVER